MNWYSVPNWYGEMMRLTSPPAKLSMSAAGMHDSAPKSSSLRISRGGSDSILSIW